MQELIELARYFLILPFLTGVFLFKRLSAIQRKVFLLVTLTIGVELLATYLRKFGNNMPAFHLATWMQALMIVFIFDGIFNGLRKTIVRLIALLFVLFSICSIFFFEGLYEFNTLQNYVANIFIILICLFFFAQLMIEAKVANPWKESSFVLAANLLIYYAGTLFVFIMANRIDSIAPNLWYFHSILFVILTLGYTIVLWMKAQK